MSLLVVFLVAFTSLSVWSMLIIAILISFLLIPSFLYLFLLMDFSPCYGSPCPAFVYVLIFAWVLDVFC